MQPAPRFPEAKRQAAASPPKDLPATQGWRVMTPAVPFWENPTQFYHHLPSTSPTPWDESWPAAPREDRTAGHSPPTPPGPAMSTEGGSSPLPTPVSKIGEALLSPPPQLGQGPCESHMGKSLWGAMVGHREWVRPGCAGSLPLLLGRPAAPVPAFLICGRRLSLPRRRIAPQDVGWVGSLPAPSARTFRKGGGSHPIARLPLELCPQTDTASVPPLVPALT